MQVEITLLAQPPSAYSARDLGFLLHKHPDHLHERETAAGVARIFFPEVGEERTTVLLHLDVDPVGLVRGRNEAAEGLLDSYVNDRPYVANSFLSVALGRAFGQSLAGKSKERQELADRPLSFAARIVPVAVAGGPDLVAALFEPLGYRVTVELLAAAGGRDLWDLRIEGEVRLADLLTHLYVLVPVLDDAKHYFVDRGEIDKLLAKGEGWLGGHPAREIITHRALKHRRGLVNLALARIAEGMQAEAQEEAEPDREAAPAPQEETLEEPIRLHDLRLDAVAAILKERDASSVLDLGCGEGRLIARLLKERTIMRILGVDASVRTLEVAARRLHLDQAGEALRTRLGLQFGSLTYADRRWHDFDAATLVEVIEHIEPSRLSALELSLFGDARPRLVVITTPNRDYNVLFAGMAAGSMRHPDHRFEWTRAEFATWCEVVAGRSGYAVEITPLGPIDEALGAPSQMAVFTRMEAAA